jgi:L-alanine-DL-glutamate epimerase-like enolase superfamily enzyme
MRIVDLRQRTIPISRYADTTLPSELDTGLVALVTDVVRDGAPIIGFGFASMGRYSAEGLIRDRFGPRLLSAAESDIANAERSNIDPMRAWKCMMRNEKPGGHGERCVAVGTLDMALWDAAAKIAGKPLHSFLAEHLKAEVNSGKVPIYASGGYYYPSRDIERLSDEIRRFLDAGYTHVKIKIGGRPLDEDRKRIDAVLGLLRSGQHLAVDAMNRYGVETAEQVARALAPYGLRWFEDICEPLDFALQARISGIYSPPIAAGEALFSAEDARNLVRYGGVRPYRDVLVFDPVHCYGIPGYLRILNVLHEAGMSPSSCHPHGGHLFCLHLAAALRLGGCESNPLSFQPFGGLTDGLTVAAGATTPPEMPGIGFEANPILYHVFRSLLDECQ